MSLEFLSPEPQPQDAQRVYQFDLRDDQDRSLAGTFTGAETFAARIWPGGAYDTLADLTGGVAWLDAPSALLGLTIAAGDLDGLDAPAAYRLRVTINPGLDDVVAFNGLIRVVPGAGNLAPPAVYIAESVMLTYAPWIEDLQAPSDLAGFLGQRARARSWLDDALVNLWKYQSYAPQIGQPGWGSRVMNTGGWDPIPSKWLRDQLAADRLIVTGTVQEIQARKAIALVCDDQVGRDGKNPYREFARENHQRARSLFQTLRAEIDLDGDGYADLVIFGGATNLR